MMNFVENRIIFNKGSKTIGELRQFIMDLSSKDYVVDFDKIIPMPKEIPLENGRYADMETNEELVEKYGYDNGYDWRHDNWGTRQNSYEPYVDANTRDGHVLCFRTAEFHPIGIINKLSIISPFPFVWVWADERQVFNNGRFIHWEDGENKIEDLTNDLKFICDWFGYDIMDPADLYELRDLGLV